MGFRSLATRHRSIANVRGQRIAHWFDLGFDQEAKTLLPKEKCIEFFKGCLANGLIMMGLHTTVRVHPAPLILSADEPRAGIIATRLELEGDRIGRCCLLSSASPLVHPYQKREPDCLSRLTATGAGAPLLRVAIIGFFARSAFASYIGADIQSILPANAF